MGSTAIIVPILVSAVLTALILPLVIRISYAKKLFDPINERTTHKSDVPRLGGGAFLFSATVGTIVAAMMIDGSIGGKTSGWAGLAASAFIVLLTGVWDDLSNLNYKYKFLSQFLSAILLVYVGDFWIGNLGGLFGVSQMTPIVGQIFTVLLVVFVINAFNLIDGIDGLASSLGIVATGVMGVLFFARAEFFMAIMSLAMTASLTVFFCYNKFGRPENRTKIFMGDGGSQTMGFFVAFLVVYASMQANLSPKLSLPYQMVIPFSLIAIPCLDALRVMIGRMCKGHNPFLADKTHIHHKLMNMGCGQTLTLLIILAFDAGFVCLNYLLMISDIAIDDSVKINLVLLFDALLWCILHLWLDARIKNKKNLALTE